LPPAKEEEVDVDQLNIEGEICKADLELKSEKGKKNSGLR
jgi:hypothetical protein